MFTFAALPAMFYGVEEGKFPYILFSFFGYTLLPDEKCSRVSRIVWKGSSVYKLIEVSFYWLFVPDSFGFETM